MKEHDRPRNGLTNQPDKTPLTRRSFFKGLPFFVATGAAVVVSEGLKWTDLNSVQAEQATQGRDIQELKVKALVHGQYLVRHERAIKELRDDRT